MTTAELTDAQLVERLREWAFRVPGSPDEGATRDAFVSNALAEIERRLARDVEETFVLPVSVSEAIRNHFGSGQRTFTAMVKRVRFAYKVWQGKYGPWTPEQAEYAEELCLWAINQAAHGTNPGHARARAYTCLDRILHHENTHEGFKRREGETFDITADLKEAFSS